MQALFILEYVDDALSWYLGIVPIQLIRSCYCPAGSEQQVEQPVDFQFAQTELMMNEIGSGAFCSEFDIHEHLVESLLSFFNQ